jgi:hypothetical protein
MRGPPLSAAGRSADRAPAHGGQVPGHVPDATGLGSDPARRFPKRKRTRNLADSDWRGTLDPVLEALGRARLAGRDPQGLTRIPIHALPLFTTRCTFGVSKNGAWK